MRWWREALDERQESTGCPHTSDILAAGLLVVGEALLWIAMPLVLFAHISR